MGLEIERKFLVVNDEYKRQAVGHAEIVQAYLTDDVDCTVRVRIYGSKGFITVKGRNAGVVRHEWEYEIPLDDARQMVSLARCGMLSKTRYVVRADGHDWEIDEFHGPLRGLVLAEIELSSADEAFTLPAFVGREVTGDTRYYNSLLVKAVQPPR